MSDVLVTNHNVVEILKNYRSILGVIADSSNEDIKARLGMGTIALMQQLTELTFIAMATSDKSELQEALDYFDKQFLELQDLKEEIDIKKSTGFPTSGSGEA